MSFQVRPTEGERWELVFLDEPTFVHALKMAPEAMEPLLESGLWLIVVFPVWSVPVRYSVGAAVSCAKDYGGKFQLGVRPFESHEEIYKWWPVSEAPAAAKQLLTVRDEGQKRGIHISTDHSIIPLWLVLKEGQVIYQGAGPRSQEELSDLMGGV